jgi:hypothetical protein
MNQALSVLFVATVVLYGCGNKTEHQAQLPEEEKAVSSDPTKALYDSVMDVHDEVMPRMGEIITLTEALKEKVAKTPDMPAGKKKEIETTVESLDKASEGMMDWMHKFSPETNAATTESKRAYLKDEMVKVERVKADMLAAIEKGKALQ